MGRGVSCGGGQSSLGYLFGNGEPSNVQAAPKGGQVPTDAPAQKSPPSAPAQKSPPSAPAQKSPPSAPAEKQVPAGIQGSLKNNYFRADGQNNGNFLTDRPSTKVHAAPGGGSSLGYLFGDGTNSK